MYVLDEAKESNEFLIRSGGLFSSRSQTLPPDHLPPDHLLFSGRKRCQQMVRSQALPPDHLLFSALKNACQELQKVYTFTTCPLLAPIWMPTFPRATDSLIGLLRVVT
eukprot:1145059-Pelagomonas_calceolata.AAC.7